LPWEEWRNDKSMIKYRRARMEGHETSLAGIRYWHHFNKNVTWMSFEKYDYYIRDGRGKFKTSNVSHVLMIGQLSNNMTLW
jgi:hypothetical protein